MTHCLKRGQRTCRPDSSWPDACKRQWVSATDTCHTEIELEIVMFTQESVFIAIAMWGIHEENPSEEPTEGCDENPWEGVFFISPPFPQDSSWSDECLPPTQSRHPDLLRVDTLTS